MGLIWLTYAWDDNTEGDVDFVVQELQDSGLNAKLDRWNISAGLPLWDQIEKNIQDKSQTNAWILYATQNSWGSERCREEFRYALDRALNSRGEEFPLIALFPGDFDKELIPAALKVRLCVSLLDADWKERIKATVEGRLPTIQRQLASPYHIQVRPNGQERCIIEVRPRAGIWHPYIVATLVADGEGIIEEYCCGPSGGQPPSFDFQSMPFSGITSDGKWAFVGSRDQVTPTQSVYVFCRRKPMQLRFGPQNGEQYIVDL